MTRFRGPSWRPIFLGAVIGAMAFGAADAASQMQRQPATATTQVNPAIIEAVVNPLKVEVQSLRMELNRLKVAHESLQKSYSGHRHAIPTYGLLSAKSIYPQTSVSDDTLVAIRTSKSMAPGTTGPPQ